MHIGIIPFLLVYFINQNGIICREKINLPMVTINYTLYKEDYFRYSFYTTWLSPDKKKVAIKNSVKNFLLLFGCSLFIKVISRSSLLDVNFLYSILILLAIYIIPLFNVATTYRKQMNPFLADPLNAHIFSNCELIFSETGIIAKGKYSSTSYQWRGIVKKDETTDYYYLFLSTVQALIIPKRAVKSEAEKIQLENLFAQHISYEAEVGHLVKD
jgi:YcxB-like protein